MKTPKKLKISDLVEFDVASYLTSDEAITEYLNQVIADRDDAELAEALGHIARAREFRELPKTSSI